MLCVVVPFYRCRFVSCDSVDVYESDQNKDKHTMLERAILCVVDYRLLFMASSNTRAIQLPPATTATPPYFLITLTNYPNVLQRTQQYQQPNQVLE